MTGGSSAASRTGFVDQVRIRVRGGDGGKGSSSFHREKHVPRGGPDGGDGGRGGSVALVSDAAIPSLAGYVRRRRHAAGGGGSGGPKNRDGADGGDLTLRVPVGTVVRDVHTDEVLADLARPGTSFVVARGGRGGRGNASLRSAHDRAPNYAEPGEPGEEKDLILELHLVADVGLIGPPNAGKSTLLSAVTRADPKIADYPFTTIEPGLGVMDRGDRRLTVADLPGLIEGASRGKGLGLRFLRHADRCAVLAAVVDLASGDPVGDLESVMAEVGSYQQDLARRIRVVVGNKTDLSSADVKGVEGWARERGLGFVAISAAAGSNLSELQDLLFEKVRVAKEEFGEPESFMVFRPAVEDRIVVVREDGAFRVRSERAERVVAQTPLDNPRAIRRLQRQLRALGVETALAREGAKEGDEVRIGQSSFEYLPDEPHA